MFRLKHLVAFAVAAVTGALVACSTPSNECSAATCGGCCDAAGVCQSGDTAGACGASGNECAVCGAAETCSDAACVPGGAVGGGAGSTGGGTASTGGGAGSTGGGAGSTGGGSASTGGGAGSTGGGTGTTGGGTGATGGGTAATGGGTGTPFDAGVNDIDAGTVVLTDGGSFQAPVVPLTFSNSCPTVSVTPGAEGGDWYYTSACLPDLFSQLPSCAQVPTKQGSIAGTVQLSGDGALIRQDFTARVYFHLIMSGSPCSFVPCNVNSISAALAQYGVPGVTGQCTSGSACECDLVRDLSNHGANAYEYDAGVLYLATDNSIFQTQFTDADHFRYRDVADGGLPGVYGVTRVGAQ